MLLLLNSCTLLNPSTFTAGTDLSLARPSASDREAIGAVAMAQASLFLQQYCTATGLPLGSATSRHVVISSMPSANCLIYGLLSLLRTLNCATYSLCAI